MFSRIRLLDPDGTSPTAAVVRRLLGDRVAGSGTATQPVPTLTAPSAGRRAAAPAPGAGRCPVGAPVHPAARSPAPPVPLVVPGAEFSTFLTDVALAVARHVEPWRSRLGEAVAFWSGEGYRVAALDRALQAETDPGAEDVVAEFSAQSNASDRWPRRSPPSIRLSGGSMSFAIRNVWPKRRRW